MDPEDEAIEGARARWRWRGVDRPPWAEEPGPGRESVWDYPRPPRVEPAGRRVRIELGGAAVADSRHALRVLETASPPVYYLPPADLAPGVLEPGRGGGSVCEWKGRARYWTVSAGGRVEVDAAWSYPEPWAGFEAIAEHVSFYPSRVDCFLDGERVRPQGGGFYGGWVSVDLAGPWKGGPGTGNW